MIACQHLDHISLWLLPAAFAVVVVVVVVLLLLLMGFIVAAVAFAAAFRIKAC